MVNVGDNSDVSAVLLGRAFPFCFVLVFVFVLVSFGVMFVSYRFRVVSFRCVLCFKHTVFETQKVCVSNFRIRNRTCVRLCAGLCFVVCRLVFLVFGLCFVVFRLCLVPRLGCPTLFRWCPDPPERSKHSMRMG